MHFKHTIGLKSSFVHFTLTSLSNQLFLCTQFVVLYDYDCDYIVKKSDCERLKRNTIVIFAILKTDPADDNLKSLLLSLEKLPKDAIMRRCGMFLQKMIIVIPYFGFMPFYNVFGSEKPRLRTLLLH